MISYLRGPNCGWVDMSLLRVRNEISDNSRDRLYRNAVLIAIFGNALLAIGKSLLAWFSGSSAVFSDAANSASDTFYSFLMSLGLYLSLRPADETHPQGHSRFEPFVSLLIAGAMGLAGITAIFQAVQRFTGKISAIESGLPTLVLLCASFIKVGMFLLVRQLGEKSRSPAIQATARDNLADILTSAAALGGVWGSDLIHPVMDPVAGIVVGLWIFRATWITATENMGYLAGRGASEELIHRIASVASEIPGVLKVHQVVADYVGPRVRVDMHINVDGEMPLRKAHDITEAVREAVEAMHEVDLVFIHLEPGEE